MHSFKQNLLMLALGFALVSPLAFSKGTPNAHAAVPAATGAVNKATGNQIDREQPPSSQQTDSTKTSTSTDASQSMKAEAQSPPGQGNWWTEADTNDDGKISTAEATANAGLSSRFGIVDTNKDGFVTMDEYRSFYTNNASQGEQHATAHSEVVTRDVWTRLDANADGRLSASELAVDVKLNGSFTAMDSNNDGFVSQAEYRAYEKTQH